MKERILTILKQYADNGANLHSEALREQLTKDIMKTFGEDSRDLDVNSSELNLPNGWIYESPDGKKIYRRKSGAPLNTRELIKG